MSKTMQKLQVFVGYIVLTSWLVSGAAGVYGFINAAVTHDIHIYFVCASAYFILCSAFIWYSVYAARESGLVKRKRACCWRKPKVIHAFRGCCWCRHWAYAHVDGKAVDGYLTGAARRCMMGPLGMFTSRTDYCDDFEFRYIDEDSS